MLKEFILFFIISTLLFVETDADLIKDLTGFHAGLQFPFDAIKHFLALVLLPLIIGIVITLGPHGILLLSTLHYFAPHLTPIATILKDVLKRFVQSVDPTVGQLVNLFNFPHEAIPKLLKILPLILPLIIISPVLGPIGSAIAFNALLKNGIMQRILGNNLSLPTLATAFMIILLFKPLFPNVLTVVMQFVRIALTVYASLPDVVPLTPFTLSAILFMSFILTPIVIIIRTFLAPPGGLIKFFIFSSPFIFFIFPKLFAFLPRPLQALLVPLSLLLQPPLAPFLLPIAPLLLTLAPILLLGPTILPALFAISLGPLLGFLGPFLVPLVPLFLAFKALFFPLLP